MSKDQIKNLKSLFAAYDAKEAELQQAKAEVEKAQQARSEVIQAIVDASDGKKKFDRGGKVLTVVRRGETLFFRGTSDNEEIISI